MGFDCMNFLNYLCFMSLDSGKRERSMKKSDILIKALALVFIKRCC